MQKSTQNQRAKAIQVLLAAGVWPSASQELAVDRAVAAVRVLEAVGKAQIASMIHPHLIALFDVHSHNDWVSQLVRDLDESLHTGIGELGLGSGEVNISKFKPVRVLLSGHSVEFFVRANGHADAAERLKRYDLKAFAHKRPERASLLPIQYKKPAQALALAEAA